MSSDRIELHQLAAEKNRRFVARWKDRLVGPLKTARDGPRFDDSWASNGNGARIELNGAPADWIDRLDRYLEDLERREPGFQIFQLKLKFGGVRLYLANVGLEEQRGANRFTDSFHGSAHCE